MIHHILLAFLSSWLLSLRLTQRLGRLSTKKRDMLFMSFSVSRGIILFMNMTPLLFSLSSPSRFVFRESDAKDAITQINHPFFFFLHSHFFSRLRVSLKSFCMPIITSIRFPAISFQLILVRRKKKKLLSFQWKTQVHFMSKLLWVIPFWWLNNSSGTHSFAWE